MFHFNGDWDTSARLRNKGPNPVEFKSKSQQKNYLKFAVPLHSNFSAQAKRNFFFYFIQKALTS